jgi:uncharacterized protein (DUF1330 family)
VARAICTDNNLPDKEFVMSKAYDDLLAIRVAFEDFERNLSANVEKSIAKHGFDKTLHVSGEVARIRGELQDLMVLMFPVPTPSPDVMSEEEWASYIG